MKPISKLLIANRGEIACRIMRTAHRLDMRTVAVYSDADDQSLHVAMADESVRIGPAPASESYLNFEAVIAAALATGADAIHPGYGFLSENPSFVDAVTAAGLTFVGPSANSIRAMGLKDAAKRLMEEAGVPVVPGYHGAGQEPDMLAHKAEEIGYPVLIKARAGGGGKGMRLVERPADFRNALASAMREAKAAFGDDGVLIEKFVTSPRHIEVQVFGDTQGNVVHLFERDCSLQRRHQKVLEEAPAPAMPDEVRKAITEAAVKAAKAINYVGAGTIEFIVDGSGPLRPDGFWFMEMNTRLQVEHPVTEAVVGHDLVEWQLRVAEGHALPVAQKNLSINGHAFEARLYAEDVRNGFLPATGKLHHLSFSSEARNDTGVRSGDVITPYYDPIIAKIITHGATRDEALAKLRHALGQTHIAGTVTNAEFLAALAAHPAFVAGSVDTGLINRDLESLIARAPVPELAVAIAAFVALRVDVSTAYAGWRNWGAASYPFRIICRDEMLARHLVLPTGGTVWVEGGAESVHLKEVTYAQDMFRARIGSTNRLVGAHVVCLADPAGTAVSVLLDGVTYRFVLPDPLQGSVDGPDHADAIVAPITGIVRDIAAAVGSVVAAGDVLITMEAMKMETSLSAPRAGTIAEIACIVGDPVEGGTMLVRLEERIE